MILRSLYSRMAVVLLVLFILVGISLVLFSVYSTDMYQQEVNQKLNREIAKLIVAEKILMQDNRINEPALKEIFHMLMVINPSIELYLLDGEGRILSFSAEPGKVKRSRVDVQPIRRLLEGEASLPFLGDDPRGEKRKKVFTAARIPEKGDLQGYLYIILGGEIYDSIIQRLQGSHILRLSVWGIVASLVVAALTALLLFAWMTRRLRLLAAAIDDYREGAGLSTLSLPEHRDDHSGDEIDRLVSAFRRMAGKIEEQVEYLKRADSSRRELVANVSHDLRTPLATLQGYMETLLIKNGALSAEERRNYLQTAIKHCNRLGKLVSNLFELAKLEAKDATLRKEAFSPGELVQDVVQKFRLAAEKKNIKIVTNIGKELPFILADIGLIERVLENLLENALRYTPEGGTISIALAPGEKEVTIHIRDTGCGIPENELPRVFDRFYQLDRSRRDKAGHSGLGLAITKQILDLHGSDVFVESRLNRGTSFSFALPVASKI